MAQQEDITALSLQEAVNIAVENNLTLKRSQLNQLNNEASLLEARGQRLPSCRPPHRDVLTGVDLSIPSPTFLRPDGLEI